jgi:hypothetical protein
MACDCLGSLRKIHLLIGRPGNVRGVRLDGSIRRLERDFLYDIVDLIGRLLKGRYTLGSCPTALGNGNSCSLNISLATSVAGIYNDTVALDFTVTTPTGAP